MLGLGEGKRLTNEGTKNASINKQWHCTVSCKVQDEFNLTAGTKEKCDLKS